MSVLLIILIVLLLLGGVGFAPFHDHSRPYGWCPSGVITLLLVVLLILFLTGYVR